MVDVEKLTDDELRTKLIEFGFPVMPITGTTRKIMVKKLKILMENKGNSNTSTNNRRSLATFSSGEEDSEKEETTKTVAKEKKNRRVTMAAISSSQNMLPPKVNSKKNDEVVTKVVTEQRTATRREIIREPDTETNSESETEIIENEFKSTTRASPAKNESPKKTFPKYSPPKAMHSPIRATIYKSPVVSTSTEDRLNQIRSRLSLGTPSYSYTSSSVFDNNGDDDEEKLDGQTPYLSNFTKRLSQISATKTTDEVKRDYGNGSSDAYRKGFQSPKPRNFKQQSPPTESKSSKVSFLVVAFVVLFFVMIAALYFGMHAEGDSTEAIGHTPKYAPKDGVEFHV